MKAPASEDAPKGTAGKITEKEKKVKGNRIISQKEKTYFIFVNDTNRGEGVRAMFHENRKGNTGKGGTGKNPKGGGEGKPLSDDEISARTEKGR